MLNQWTEVVGNGLRNLITSRNQPSSEDSHPTTISHSHASRLRTGRASLPEQPMRKYLTKNLRTYVRDNDNVQSDPIPIEDDEDESVVESQPRISKSRHETQPTLDQSPTSIRDTRVEHMAEYFTVPTSDTLDLRRRSRSVSGEEYRLLGGLTYTSQSCPDNQQADHSASRRQPRPTTVQDPMMRSSAALKSGLRPINTLEAPRPPARSDHISSITHPQRLPQNHGFSVYEHIQKNDHNRPNKRRRIETSHEEGNTITNAISLDDSQPADDSGDELRLSPTYNKRGNGEPPRSHRRASVAAKLPQDPIDDPSPDDESDFTKASAKLRKAAKDKMLGSSSPGRPDQALPVAVASPYFGSKSGTPSVTNQEARKQSRRKALEQESPDALQTEAPHTRGQSRSLQNVRATEFTHLILGNDRSTTITHPKNTRTKPQTQVLRAYKLQELVHPSLQPHSIYVVQIDEQNKQLSINTDLDALGNDPVARVLPLEKIIEIRHGSNCGIVSLEFSRSDRNKQKSYLRFESQKQAWIFVMSLQKLVSIPKVLPKEDAWMERALSLTKQTITHELREKIEKRTPVRPRTAEQHIASSRTSPPTKANTAEKRARLVDKLDLPHPRLIQRTVISGTERSGLQQSEPRPDNDNRLRSSPGAEPSKKLQQDTNPLRRVTRSQEPVQKSTTERNSDDSHNKTRLTDIDVLGDPWKNDLIYRIGDKRTGSVPFEDLSRLGHEEYLNDSLISFFVHYLETQLGKAHPESVERIHFFNTYFFETLTKTPRGKRGINYEGVSKWTKAVDLFKRDFVVVPVNENFHWYLVVICNLPYFLPDHEKDARQGLRHPEGYDGSEQPSEDVDMASDAPTEETQKSLAELSISDHEANRQLQTKARSKKSPGRRKSIRPLRKYEIDKPVIITLDSLGTPRSATCSIIRQYVVAEAKDKKNFDIDSSQLRGMTAKEIPTQSNFSDCGLYLCMYLEQFVADPDRFVYNILQREGSTHQWPEKIQGHALRMRLRDLLLELHRRQEQEESKMEIPEVGGIMIKRKKISVSQSVFPIPPTKKKIEEAKLRLRLHSIQDARDSTDDDDDDAQVEHGQAVKVKSLTKSSKEPAGAPDVVSHTEEESSTDQYVGDLAAEQIAAPKPTGSRNQAASHPLSGDGSSKTVVQVQASPSTGSWSEDPPPRAFSHSNPGELAEHLRRENRAWNSKDRQQSSSDQKHRKRRARSGSASTDFLTGAQSYAEPNVSMAESPGIQIIKERTISDLEAIHGRRKRKRHAETSVFEAERAEAESDVTAEIPETQTTSAETQEHREIPIKKQQVLQFEVFEDEDAGPSGEAGKA
ncbi:hypothetical protein LTR99_008561 [Exophiala xenobiotica]|uniref:Ubiquitin-like protease family profile domain-containing protein n=1 Tax=Vermiconidia calcicola TaxID=1690605 RepID=A0AAV9Q4C6_9PEZI|nr:hypothetical protein LTR99_008561 [Exophiala xenobiotica]KAK5532951.1 hypothetical protein LTR25_007655 [Vermiconidia calcicola]KAK5546681.1 hypothetical protein LTR23_003428 [Chaetothyriales sp. CCFEE 6169]